MDIVTLKLLGLWAFGLPFAYVRLRRLNRTLTITSPSVVGCMSVGLWLFWPLQVALWLTGRFGDGYRLLTRALVPTKADISE